MSQTRPAKTTETAETAEERKYRFEKMVEKASVGALVMDDFSLPVQSWFKQKNWQHHFEPDKAEK